MTALYDAARKFAAAFPHRPPSRSRGSWDQLCGVAMYQFVGFLGGLSAAQIARDAGTGWRVRPARSIASAIIVARGSGKLNPNQSAAPIGAFHFWDIGRYGHVGIGLTPGGNDIFMASYKLRESWGDAIGIQSVDGYSRATGARYLGFSTQYAGGLPKLPAEPKPKPAATRPAPAAKSWSYWEPSGPLAARIQRALRARGRYAGRIDGKFGPLSRAGVQASLRNAGLYTGPIDGVIAAAGSRAIQLYAKRFGDYTGPIDGAPREASWTGFALGLERP